MNEENRLKSQIAALNRPAQRQPSRRPSSIRRTSSIQTFWPYGSSKSFMMIGRSRDIETASNREVRIIGEDNIETVMGEDGRIATLEGSRLGDLFSRFKSLHVGGELRRAMARDIAEEGERETRLHRLLDDLAGATFMSIASWYAWEDSIAGFAARAGVNDPTLRPVEGVCLSYVPGSPSMTAGGLGIEANADHPIGPLPIGQDDPPGFHSLEESDGPNQWRLRRTDIWRDDDSLVVDAWFQDSSAIQGDPTRRVIFHEYGLVARIDAGSLAISSITVTPHVLPYVTCHAAPATARQLEGRNVRELRGLVPVLLKGSAGCTHLNDMLRALQDVAGLAKLIKHPE